MASEMKKIKVLHRAATTGAGGVEKYVFNHYRYMDQNQFQFDFITRNQHLCELREIQELKMAVRAFTATQSDNKELLIKQITDILDCGYDILHMNTSMWAGFLIEELAMERGIPVIVHAHSSGIDHPIPEKRREWLERHQYYKKRFGKEHANCFCACSYEAAEWLFGSQIPKEEIHILKNAIEVEKYSFDQDKRNSIRRQLGLDSNFVIGHVGRFAYQKNHEFLITLFKRIFHRNNQARLLLIGQGELEEKIRKQIKELGLEEAVMFLGWREDVNDLMQAMDLFVLPSRFEGLPVVAVEAQAAGLPCVLSDTITKEVLITENIKMLSCNLDIWEMEIVRIMHGLERKKMDREITKAGYNIQYAVKELESIYRALL